MPMPKIKRRRVSLICRHSPTLATNNGNGHHGSHGSCEDHQHNHSHHHHHHSHDHGDHHSHYPESAVSRFLSRIGLIQAAETLAHSGKWTVVSIASFILAALAGTELAARLLGSTVAHAGHCMALSVTFLLSGLPQVRGPKGSDSLPRGREAGRLLESFTLWPPWHTMGSLIQLPPSSPGRRLRQLVLLEEEPWTPMCL